jgi:hypothetical protein
MQSEAHLTAFLAEKNKNQINQVDDSTKEQTTAVTTNDD